MKLSRKFKGRPLAQTTEHRNIDRKQVVTEALALVSEVIDGKPGLFLSGDGKLSVAESSKHECRKLAAFCDEAGRFLRAYAEGRE